MKCYLAIALTIAVVMLGACSWDTTPTAPPLEDQEHLVQSSLLIPPDDTDTDGDGVSDYDEELIIRQFRPAWAYDTQEAWFPLSLEEWADHGGWIGTSSNSYYGIGSFINAVYAYPTSDMHNTDYIPESKVFCYDTYDYHWQMTDPDCNNAPVFSDAIPVSWSYAGRTNLVWIHYWLFSGSSGTYLGYDHYGDWEHICVLASLDDLGSKEAPPVSLHFHNHGDHQVVESPAWRSDRRCRTSGLDHPLCYGTKHPIVYVEAWGHGSFHTPGDYWGPAFGGFLETDDMLNNPLDFLNDQMGSTHTNLIQAFSGRWGLNSTSPRGPTSFNNLGDHDFLNNYPSANCWIGFTC